MAAIAQEQKKMGRPEKPIDWDKVIKALEYGATGVQIASYFGVYPDTLYRQIELKFGLTFTAFAALHTPKGEFELLAKQHELAFKGNTQLLLRLGEERLGQGRKRDIEVAEAVLVNFEKFTEMLNARQEKVAVQASSEALQISDTSNSEDSKS